MALFRSYQKVAYFVAVSETEFCCSFSKNARIKNLPSLTLNQLIGSYATIHLLLALSSIKKWQIKRPSTILNFLVITLSKSDLRSTQREPPSLVRFVLYARSVVQLPFEWDILGLQWRYSAESQAKVIDLKDLSNNRPVGLVKSCVMKVFLRLIVGHFIISKKVKA